MLWLAGLIFRLFCVCWRKHIWRRFLQPTCLMVGTAQGSSAIAGEPLWKNRSLLASRTSGSLRLEQLEVVTMSAGGCGHVMEMKEERSRPCVWYQGRWKKDWECLHRDPAEMRIWMSWLCKTEQPVCGQFLYKWRNTVLRNTGGLWLLSEVVLTRLLSYLEKDSRAIPVLNG